MSVKIYHGYRMPEVKMSALLTWCQAIRVRATEIQWAALLKAYGSEDGYREKWSDLQSMAWEAKHTGKRTASIADWSFTITFLPVEEYLLIIPYTEHDELMDLIGEHSHVQEFGYWNNSDPIGTKKKWAERKRLWGKALLDDKDGVPAHHGFDITILGYDLPIPRKILEGKNE